MTIRLKFTRWDRVPGGDHVYGDTADSAIENLDTTGGLDRSATDPAVPLEGFATELELHEDGPEVELADAHVTGLTRRLEPLRAAWLDWNPRDWRLPKSHRPREIEVTAGPHRYVGRPQNVAELRAVIRLLQKLNG